MAADSDLAKSVGEDAIDCLEYGLNKIDHCLKQLDEGQVWWRPTVEMNSIGNLLIHLAGNLRQWIVAGVGDADDTRQRQQEFDERGPIRKSQVRQTLLAAVTESIEAIRTVTEEQWLSPKRVQGRDVTKLHAMMHSVTHFQGHVQEIICLTRQQLGERYEFEWAPQTPEEGAN